MNKMTLKEMELLYWALDAYDENLPKDTAETADNVRKMLELSIWEKKQSIVKQWDTLHDLCLAFVHNVNDLANKKADNFVVTKTGALADNEIDAIIEGESNSKVPSTIIMVDGDNIKMLREGNISLKQVWEVIKK